MKVFDKVRKAVNAVGWRIWGSKDPDSGLDLGHQNVPHYETSVWLNSGGIGISAGDLNIVNGEPVTGEAFNRWVNQSRVNGLRASIESARRNKKKSSHLVAELDKLENGK